MDIYSRVRELVEDKKEALTMEQILLPLSMRDSSGTKR